MSVRSVSVIRLTLFVAIAGLLAGCGSTSPVTTSAVSPAARPGDVVVSRTAAPMRNVSSADCSPHVSAAECRRIHAEGVRLMLASCPPNDARCARVRVVSVRRVNARTARMTVRDTVTGQQTVRNVPVSMLSRTAQ